MAWVCASCGAGQADDRSPWCSACGTGHRPAAGESPTGDGGGANEGESLVRAGAGIAGLLAVDMLVWLLPVLVLGGVGLVLLNAGSQETVDAFGQSHTEHTPTGWIGAAFLCFAVAVFFGRGVVRKLYGMFRSHKLPDAGDVKDNLTSLGIAIVAVLAGILFLAFATGTTDPPDNGNTPSQFPQDTP